MFLHTFRRHLLTLSLLMISFSHPIYAADVTDYIKPYGDLLNEYVTLGQKQGINAALVDYEAWGNNPKHAQAVDALLAVDPAPLKGAEKMAYWINAYNLLTVDLIVKTGEQDSIKNQGSFFKNVWKTHSWVIQGKSYTLDQIEHAILRPMGEARIHVAINCASLSCPDLLNEPYQSNILEDQLAQQTQLFLQDTTKGVMLEGDDLAVSKIFKWFAEDFGGKQGVETFIGSEISAYKGKGVDSYLTYNWSLNSQ